MAAVVGFVGEFASSVIQPTQSGALTMRLDSLQMGQYDATALFGAAVGPAIPTQLLPHPGQRRGQLQDHDPVLPG